VLQIVSEDIFTLAASERPEDHAVVVGMLRRPELELRLAAADALGMRGTAPGDVPALIEALNDSVPLLRKKVGRAIRSSPSLYLLIFEDVALGKTGIAVHFIPAR
jgi:hypothetical protein